MILFKCDQCGLCCRSVGTSYVYKDLDRGDGVCRYFQDKMTKVEFFELNYRECDKLKRMYL